MGVPGVLVALALAVLLILAFLFVELRVAEAR